MQDKRQESEQVFGPTNRYQRVEPERTLGQSINQAGDQATELARSDDPATRFIAGTAQGVQAEVASTVNLFAGGQRVVRPADTYIESLWYDRPKAAEQALDDPARTAGQTVGHLGLLALPIGLPLRGAKVGIQQANKVAALLYKPGTKQGVERVGPKQFIVSEGVESRPGSITYLDFAKGGKAVQYEPPAKVLPSEVTILGKAGQTEQKLYGARRTAKNTWQIDRPQKLLAESGPGLKPVAVTKTTRITDVRQQVDAIYKDRTPPDKPQQTTGIILQSQYLSDKPSQFSRYVDSKLGKVTSVKAQGPTKPFDPASTAKASPSSTAGKATQLDPQTTKTIKDTLRTQARQKPKTAGKAMAMTAGTVLVAGSRPATQQPALDSTVPTPKTAQGQKIGQIGRVNSQSMARTATSRPRSNAWLAQGRQVLDKPDVAVRSARASRSQLRSTYSPAGYAQGRTRPAGILSVYGSKSSGRNRTDDKKRRKRLDYEAGAYPDKITGLRDIDIMYKRRRKGKKWPF